MVGPLAPRNMPKLPKNSILQSAIFAFLSLALLMLYAALADDIDLPLPSNNPAMLTNFLNRRSYFHRSLPQFITFFETARACSGRMGHHW